MQTAMRYERQRVLVTGASRGLGEALVRELTRSGARVVALSRDGERLAALAGETGAHAIVADVADKEAVYAVAGEVVHALGGVDLIIHNAGYLGATPLRLLADTDCEDLERSLAVNVVGPFRLTKALLPSLLLDGGGTVVTLSSDAAVSAYPRWGAYSVGKAALDHLARIFAAELESHGVRFLALDPGDMRTAMHFAAIPDADPETLRDPARVAEAMLAFLARARQTEGVRFSASAWRDAMKNEAWR